MSDSGSHGSRETDDGCAPGSTGSNGSAAICATHVRGLDGLLTPRSVAVVGASERAGSLGRTVIENLVKSGFAGPIGAVNIKRGTVFGRPAVGNVRELAAVPDLVVIAVPARQVEAVVADCAEIGVSSAIILSAGFEQLGNDSKPTLGRILKTARNSGLRLIGPNCLGIIRPSSRLNASFAASMARPGRLAFLSQSGALCTAVLDWSMTEGIGFSAFASVGSMLDVGWADLFDFFAEDSETDCILAYVESVGDARSFLAAARTAALKKPIIVLKGGRTEAAAQAAVSHTGALACSDDVFDAAMQRVGILRVDELAELFHVAEVLSKQPRPAGRRLTILTNAGGPGILATDALIRGGGELAPVPANIIEHLDRTLPAYWSRQNPIDIIGDADPARFREAVKLAIENPESDGLLVILTPQAMTDPTSTARELLPVLKKAGKTVITSWMGGDAIREANELFNEAGIPTFAYPDTAARVFNDLWRYRDELQNLYETPLGSSDAVAATKRQAEVSAILDQVLETGRTILTEEESKRVLELYGIPTNPTFVALSSNEAVTMARRIGYPVVLKLHSKTQTHKSDVGGVRLNLASDEAVREAYSGIWESMQGRGESAGFQGVSVQPMERRHGIELILGSSCDSQFGPCVLFGSGGTLVEILGDRAVGIPPLNSTLARRLIEKTKISGALKGFRQRPAVDLKQLESVLTAYSELVVEQGRIRECDINPLFATASGIIALDARIVLHPAEKPVAEIPRPAIRPYPLEYVRSLTLKDGTPIVLRPIRLEDEGAMVRFHSTLSEDSLYQRYFGLSSLSQRTDHSRLIRVCLNDFDCQMAVVAVKAGSEEILGVGRLGRARESKTAEFALLVSDAWQHRGLGGALLDQLMEIGRTEGVERLTAVVLQGNSAMANLCRAKGFEIRGREMDSTVQFDRILKTKRGRSQATPP